MKAILLSIYILLTSTLLGQTFDSPLSQRKMKKDLEVFKKIRLEANSGLNRYRTKEETDSMFHWAEREILNLKTYGDFYNLINTLTDFEGSLHNGTYLPESIHTALKEEQTGYFPYPIKWIDGHWIINYETKSIPAGSIIYEINGEKIEDIIPKLYKYYTTDGYNITGKRIGINYHFGRYYRMEYGLQHEFVIRYSPPRDFTTSKQVHSVSYKTCYQHTKGRYSSPLDQYIYKDRREKDIYTFKQIDKSTGLLKIHTFGIGDNESDPKHKAYVAFLDSIFTHLNTTGVENLIVDIRENGGGTDPNDLETYSYLTQRPFQENKEAWISFHKIPYIRYYDSPIPKFLRPLGVGKFNKLFQKAFPVEKDGKFYQDSTSKDHQVRQPKPNAFKGQIYMLISPAVASAGSLFGAMLAGNDNTISIGEESCGGYYGHNGHTPFTYVLPKSKIKTVFSVVNLEQDVPVKANQHYTRGIIPDHIVTQSVYDFLNYNDTQMNFVLELIKKRKAKATHE